MDSEFSKQYLDGNVKDRNENRPGYKKTKAGWIPNQWQARRIKDVGQVQAGRQRSPNFTKGKIWPYLRVANILEGRIDTNDVLSMKFTEEEYERYCLHKNDILLNEGQSLELVGRCAVYRGQPPKCCFQNTLVRFRPNDPIKSDFAYALFTYLQKSGTFARIASRTTSIAHLGVERLACLTIPVPTVPEQDEIAKIILFWDQTIEETRKLIDAKKRRKKALLQQLLTGKLRLKGSAGKWKKFPLKSLLKQVSRPVEFDDFADYSLLSVRRRSGGVFSRGILKGSDIKTKSMYVVRTGDFLISKMQIVHGASAVVEKEHNGMHISGSYIVLRVKDGKINTDFLKWLSKTPYFYHLTYLASYGVHIEKMTFNLRLFLKSEIEIPTDTEEQQRIAETLNEADNEINILGKKLAALEKQKRGLMQKLLTGEVRVKVDHEIHETVSNPSCRT